MNNKHLLWVGSSVATLAVVSVGLLGPGCAQGEVDFGEGDETEPATTTGDGGAGGAGGGGGAGGDTGPCPIDCTTIKVPDCKVARCNLATEECEVIDADDGAACDDGKFCTVKESCLKGVCTVPEPENPAYQNDCGLDVSACQTVTCDETKKACSAVAKGNGDPCVSDNKCHVNAKCQNGLCIGTEKDCFFAPVPNECYVATCNPDNGMCEAKVGNEGLGCSDPNEKCTVDKVCQNGMCVGGKPKDCSALTKGCVDGVCDSQTGTCGTVAIAPGQPCAEAKTDCTVGECDTMGKCQPKPANQGGLCEDKNPCTSGETCNNGVCQGGMQVTQTVYFADDFSNFNNPKGWTLGPEWAIGATKTSSGQDYAGPDPDLDHTTTTDNGVAGVVLGGNASTASLHDFYWLTSPAVNVASVQGSLWLGFWRWLNSDYLPFMQNRVQVYDGVSWVTLWESGGSPGVNDTAWALQTYDIGKYKNAALQVRFGFNINSSGVFDVASWNIDDVVIANVVCTQ
jgi:hypothetical protein